MTRRVLPMLVLAALAPVAAGCGGGSSKPKTLSKADYAKQANAVCRAAAKKAPAFPGKKAGSGYQTTASAVLPYLEKVHELNVQTLIALRDLRPPASEQAAVKKLLAAQKARVQDLDRALGAAQNKDAKGFTAAFQADQKKDAPRYYAAAAKLGLSVCAGQSA
jgi:hypothetical protein